jgi:cyclophilin family peptidyl-prolyl cis-trans isomerase
MANAGPSNDGRQFFLTFVPTPWRRTIRCRRMNYSITTTRVDRWFGPWVSRTQ